MDSHLQIWSLIEQAGLVVQGVMLILLIASILVWAVIFSKFFQYRRARRTNKAFLDFFWQSSDLSEVYAQLDKGLFQKGTPGVVELFEVGFKEFVRLQQQNSTPSATIEGVERKMRVSFNRAIEVNQSSLPMLATIGSSSPYIGLFGTVWGIMNAFLALGAMQQATLATVAPGLAEALIATAMGLVAAIPAVIAYNRLMSASNRFSNEYEMFADEFVAILHRQALMMTESTESPQPTQVEKASEQDAS